MAEEEEEVVKEETRESPMLVVPVNSVVRCCPTSVVRCCPTSVARCRLTSVALYRPTAVARCRLTSVVRCCPTFHFLLRWVTLLRCCDLCADVTIGLPAAAASSRVATVQCRTIATGLLVDTYFLEC